MYLKYIEEICEFLETTPNYLFYGSMKDDFLTSAKKKMIRLFRKLDKGRKRCIQDTLRYFAAADFGDESYVVEDEIDEKPLLKRSRFAPPLGGLLCQQPWHVAAHNPRQKKVITDMEFGNACGKESAGV